MDLSLTTAHEHTAPTSLRRHIANWFTNAALSVFATGSMVTIIRVALLLIHHFSHPPAIGGGG